MIIPGLPTDDGLTARPFRDADDYDAMAALIRVTDRHDGIPWLPTGTDIRADYDGSESLVPSTDIVFVEAASDLVAFGVVARIVRDGVPTYEAMGHVHPSWRRRGVGSAILDANLARARVRAQAEDPGAVVLAQAYANEREDGHRAILAARGFDAVRHYFEMVRPHIETVRELPVPDGIELRPVTPDQHRAIWEAEHEAFQDHWGARTDMDNDFTSTFGHPALDTSLWVVAWDGDQVAGVAQGWIWLEENEALGVQRGWLERISVRRPWRNRGLGRALTTAGMVRLHMAGMSEAMLGVDSENRTGALGLYEGLGFTIAGRSAAYRRTL